MSYHPRAVGLDPLERRDSDTDNRRDALLFSATGLGDSFIFVSFILLRLLVWVLLLSFLNQNLLEFPRTAREIQQQVDYRPLLWRLSFT